MMNKLLAMALGLGLSAGVAQAQPSPESYDQAQDYAPTTAPPANTPPPPAYGVSLPAGQWIFTAQYGWVWMPQSTSYFNGDYAYVYMPTYGWTWRTAPWMFDVGPRPYYSYGYGHRHYEHWSPRVRPGYRYHAERFRPERGPFRGGERHHERDEHRERNEHREHRG